MLLPEIISVAADDENEPCELDPVEPVPDEHDDPPLPERRVLEGEGGKRGGDRGLSGSGRLKARTTSLVHQQ
jgi:hypothetical protein